MILVFIALFIASGYIVYNYSFESIIYGTIAIILLFSYIGLYSVKHINPRDSASALVIGILFILAGLIAGLILGGRDSIGAIYYALSMIIVLITMAYAVSKYIL